MVTYRLIRRNRLKGLIIYRRLKLSLRSPILIWQKSFLKAVIFTGTPEFLYGILRQYLMLMRSICRICIMYLMKAGNYSEPNRRKALSERPTLNAEISPLTTESWKRRIMFTLWVLI